jgi:hypothetical protein
MMSHISENFQQPAENVLEKLKTLENVQKIIIFIEHVIVRNLKAITVLMCRTVGTYRG